MAIVSIKYDAQWIGNGLHCPSGHQLRLSTSQYSAKTTTVAGGGGGCGPEIPSSIETLKGSNWSCNSCGIARGDQSFHCFRCAFDLCEVCVARIRFRSVKSADQCRLGHELAARKSNLRCERCTRTEPEWDTGVCDQCAYVLCDECRGILRHPPARYDCCNAGHVLQKSKRRTAWHCARCFARSPESGRYRCNECAVDVCRACLLDAKRRLVTSVNVCAYGHSMAVDSSKKKLITCARCFGTYANTPFKHCAECAGSAVSNVELCEGCVLQLGSVGVPYEKLSTEELTAKRDCLAADLAAVQAEFNHVQALLASRQ